MCFISFGNKHIIICHNIRIKQAYTIYEKIGTLIAIDIIPLIK